MEADSSEFQEPATPAEFGGSGRSRGIDLGRKQRAGLRKSFQESFEGTADVEAGPFAGFAALAGPPFLSWCPEGKETLRYEVPGEGMV